MIYIKTNQIIITAILIALSIGGGFFAGTKYQQSKISSRMFNRQGINLPNRNDNGTNRAGFRSTSGEITAVDDKSITVKLDAGGSKIVFLSDKTQIITADTASISALTVGQKVAAFGAENTDGSLTAQNIQLNPISRGPVQ